MTPATRSALLLVACLGALLSLGCARQQESTAVGGPAVPSGRDDASLSTTAREVIGWLPGDHPVAGWARGRAPQVFNADNLWEAIDGGADSYITFGFQELVTAACVEPAAGGEATVEVYRMADSVNAFGIYAQERNPKATFVETGAEGYTAPNIVNFWNGSFYVKVTAVKSNDRVAASLLKLANALSARIGPPSAAPAIIAAFPRRDQVERSVKYVPRDVLGQSYLANGFEAQYSVGGKRARLVTASFDSARDAADGFARYRKFVASSGRPPREISSVGDGTFAGSDSFNGTIVATRADRRIVVALGVPSERAALDLIKQFLAPQEVR